MSAVEFLTGSEPSAWDTTLCLPGHSVLTRGALHDKGNTGYSDIQDIQDSQDSHDIQRLTAHPGVRSTGTGPSAGDSDEEKMPGGEESASEEENSWRKYNRERAEWFSALVSRPLADFVAKAWEHDHQRKENGDWEEWQGPVFYFAWILRGHPELQPFLAKAPKAITMIEKIMRRWTVQSVLKRETPPFGLDPDRDVWREWFDTDKEDARAEFATSWARARFKPGDGPLEQAVAAAKGMRLLLPDAIREVRPLGEPGKRDEKDYEFFVTVAGHLQVINGSAPIKLPCHAMSILLKVSTRTIGRYRIWAVEDGFMRITKDHKFVHQRSSHNESTEFVFDVSRWEVLKKKAQGGTIDNFHKAGILAMVRAANNP